MQANRERMKKTTLCLAGLIVCSAAIVSWRIHRNSVAAIEATDAARMEREAQAAEIQRRSAALSSQLAQESSSHGLSETQLRELLRLRHEVGQLLAGKLEIQQLQATNRLLEAALPESQRASTATRWDRDQLQPAGYHDPESAMITTLWALGQDAAPGTFSAVNETNALRSAEYRRRIGELLNPAEATGITLVQKKETAAGEVLLDLYYEGEGKTRRFLMKQVDGSWQLADLVSITAH